MFFKKKKKDNKISADSQLINECKDIVNKGDIDLAIKKLEEYIDKEEKLGKVFSYLMDLYNEKLKKARENGNDELIKKYLDKIDSLMKKSKDIIRGR